MAFKLPQNIQDLINRYPSMTQPRDTSWGGKIADNRAQSNWLAGGESPNVGAATNFFGGTNAFADKTSNTPTGTGTVDSSSWIGPNISDESELSKSAPGIRRQLEHPSAAENWWNYANPQLQSETPYERNAQDIMNRSNQQTAEEAYWGKTSGELANDIAKWRGLSSQHTGEGNLAYQQYQRSLADNPQLAADAGVADQYNIARDRASRDIKSAAASGGLLGSSYMIGQVGATEEKLAADQAAAEADYRLKVASENRLRNAMLGEQATGAETSQRGWGKDMGDLVTGGITTGIKGATAAGGSRREADQTGATAAQIGGNLWGNRMDSGRSGSTTASNAEMSRLDAQAKLSQALDTGDLDTFNALAGQASGLSKSEAGITQQGYTDLITSDANLLQMALQGDLSGLASAMGIQNTNDATQTQTLQTAVELIKTLYGGGGK